MEQQLLPTEQAAPHTDTRIARSAGTSDVQTVVSQPSLPETEAESVETLGAKLSRLVNRDKKRSRRAIWSIPVFYVLMAMLSLLSTHLFGMERGAAFITSPLFLLSFMLFWIGTIGYLFGSIVRPRKKNRQLARELADSNDVRAAGPLIDTFKLDDSKIHQIAINALTGLLPHLRADDADLLNAQQRDQLCRIVCLPPYRFVNDVRMLFHPENPQTVTFRVAILQAFTHIGDSRALPVVERLANKVARTEGEQRIQEAAKACLTALQLRAEQERSSQTLLRAAQHADAGADTLLRPAAGTQESIRDQLLRPGPPPP